MKLKDNSHYQQNNSLIEAESEDSNSPESDLEILAKKSSKDKIELTKMNSLINDK